MRRICVLFISLFVLLSCGGSDESYEDATAENTDGMMVPRSDYT